MTNVALIFSETKIKPKRDFRRVEFKIEIREGKKPVAEVSHVVPAIELNRCPILRDEVWSRMDLEARNYCRKNQLNVVHSGALK